MWDFKIRNIINKLSCGTQKYILHIIYLFFYFYFNDYIIFWRKSTRDLKFSFQESLRTSADPAVKMYVLFGSYDLPTTSILSLVLGSCTLLVMILSVALEFL